MATEATEAKGPSMWEFLGIVAIAFACLSQIIAFLIGAVDGYTYPNPHQCELQHKGGLLAPACFVGCPIGRWLSESIDGSGR